MTAPRDPPFAPYDPTSRVLVIGPGLALASAATAGVPVFERLLPAHTILMGLRRLRVGEAERTDATIAIPAGTRHTPLEFAGAHACVGYLDPRRFKFADAAQLAESWRGFRPGVDDLREAAVEAMAVVPPRIDGRIARALDAIEQEGLSVAEAAARVKLSASRLTHLTTEALGAAPRVWSAWFKLLRAIQYAAAGANLTEAAHRAGFADSAHLTRTCRQMTGVRPGKMIPESVHVLDPREGEGRSD